MGLFIKKKYFRFCTESGIPNCIFKLLEKLLSDDKAANETWFGQIIHDLLALLTAYVASDFNIKDFGPGSMNQFKANVCKIIPILHRVMTSSVDVKNVVTDQALLNLIFMCESADHGKQIAICQSLYNSLVDSKIVEYLCKQFCNFDLLIKRLEKIYDSSEKVEQRSVEIQSLIISGLSATINCPVVAFSTRRAKQVVALCAAKAFVKLPNAAQILGRCILIQPACINSLKVMYYCSQVSQAFCNMVMTEEMVNLLISVIESPDQLQVEFVKQSVELCLYILATFVYVNSDKMLELLTNHVILFSNIFVESEVPTHVLSAAMLINELSKVGAVFELSIADFCTTTSLAVSNLTEVDILPPFDYGIIDGVIGMVRQLVEDGGGPTAASELINCDVWNALWYRIAHALHVDVGDDSDTETLFSARPQDTEDPNNCYDPMLISPQGILSHLHVSIAIWDKNYTVEDIEMNVSYNYVPSPFVIVFLIG